MNIEARDFEVKMTYGEMWSTALDVKSALTNTLKTHWVNHQDVWKTNEEDRLIRIKIMFYSLGRPDLYESIFTEADVIFKDFNSKKASK